MSNSTERVSYGYGPLVVECKRRGIGRTMAYELQKRGLIETFALGSKRMVKIASLESLPDRLAGSAPAEPTTPPAPRV